MQSQALGILLLFASACSSLAPAKTPPQIQHTPGAFVIISRNYFDAGNFQLEYPANWRVVKLSTADSKSLKIAFVAPDQSIVFLTQVENTDKNVIRLDNGVALAVEIDASDNADSGFFNDAKHLISLIRA